MMWTDDPVRDAERWMEAQDLRLELLPKCCGCGQPIQQEDAVCVDGYWYCEECELDAWPEIRKHYLERVDHE